MGTGRLVWRVYRDGPARSLVVLSMRLDLRESNYVTRQINRGARSTNRTINISLGLVMLLGTRRELTGRRKDGNLFATGPGGVLVFAPDGTHLGTIDTNEPTANCCFGDDGTVLYIATNVLLDIAYTWVDRGEHLEEAKRMLDEAVRQKPAVDSSKSSTEEEKPRGPQPVV